MILFLTPDDFKKRIEFSLVSHFLSEEDVKRKCKPAINSEVGVICVNPNYVKLVKDLIGNRNIELSVNVGFPWGTHYTEFKVLEAKKALRDGANQIDMVINIGALRSNKDDEVYNDIKAVVDITKNCLVKVIIETWVLSRNEKVRACKIAEEAGAQLIKTTTGVRTQYITKFCGSENVRGALLEDIILLKKILSPKTKIKASGGVYTLSDAFEMIKNGADQLGVSKGVKLIAEFNKKYKNGLEI